MSLDNTSHPGRPGPDELVPSRYALRVGEIDVLVVSDGVLSLPAAMLATNADPAVREAWLDDMFLPRDVLEWPLNVVVVRSGGRTILVDAGLGADPDLHLPQAGRTAQRVHLAAAEVKFWASPDFSRTSMPQGFPDALRRAAKRFLNEYQSQLRPFEAE